MEARRWTPQGRTRGVIWVVRVDMATDQLGEICQGALPAAHMPRLTATGFGITCPEDPTVLNQCRK
eukprot:1906647-Alexandrium_andersonii.AAC.1